MRWELDDCTKKAAEKYPLKINRHIPSAQFEGRNFNPVNWHRWGITNNRLPELPFRSSPENIIAQFEEGNYLNGLALVVSWGTMWRQNNRIYGDHDHQLIQEALGLCAKNLQETRTINWSWSHLTRQLGWSPVIASKTLHFLSRATGFRQEPPVAFDNAVILNTVWPLWQAEIPIDQRPRGWRYGDFQSYLRYMTAIIIWARQRRWTTTQMEATIFDAFHKKNH